MLLTHTAEGSNQFQHDSWLAQAPQLSFQKQRAKFSTSPRTNKPPTLLRLLRSRVQNPAQLRKSSRASAAETWLWRLGWRVCSQHLPGGEAALRPAGLR